MSAFVPLGNKQLERNAKKNRFKPLKLISFGINISLEAQHLVNFN